jgi:hypothetical protein
MYDAGHIDVSKLRYCVEKKEDIIMRKDCDGQENTLEDISFQGFTKLKSKLHLALQLDVLGKKSSIFQITIIKK